MINDNVKYIFNMGGKKYVADYFKGLIMRKELARQMDNRFLIMTEIKYNKEDRELIVEWCGAGIIR